MIEERRERIQAIMAQNDIGIDLGTTTIIIAQEGKGVVLNQPSVVAMDTRKNSVLEAGDKALAMVGRTPNYISAIFPLKDGVISDHTMTRELICRFVKQVYSSHMVKPRVAVCVPAAITGIESDAVVEAVVAAGARQVYLIDEPIAAALGSGIDITVPDGRMIIDIRLNETGITLRLNIFMQGASCQFIPTTQGQMLQDASACKAVCSNYQRFHQNEYINTPNIR